jgi:hypothetical protein
MSHGRSFDSSWHRDVRDSVRADLRDRSGLTVVIATISGADLFGLVVAVLICAYLLYALLRGDRL